MRVILFIGHHKVGTTSLQHYLSRNYHSFLANSILYPMVETQGLTYQMARATGALTAKDAPPINATEPHNALGFRMWASAVKTRQIPEYHGALPGVRIMFDAIWQQIETYRPKTVILCAEVFANFGIVAPALIKQLSTQFGAESITLMATLRRPDDYLASWHGQRYKFGAKLRGLSEGGLGQYFHDSNATHFDYQRMLAGWDETFTQAGADMRWILRDHADVMAAGGSIADFVAQNKISIPRGAVDVPNINPSIPRAFQELARRGNHALTGPAADLLRNYLIDAAKRVAHTPDKNVEMFGAQKRAVLVEKFDPIHDWLSAFSQRPKFFADIDDMRNLRDVPWRDALMMALPALQKDARRRLDSDEARSFVETFQLADVDAAVT